MCIVLGVIAVAIAVAIAMVRTASAAVGSGVAALPSTVSVRGRDMSAKDAYERVAKEAGIRITWYSAPPADDRRVSLNLVHEPFWEAIAQITRTSGMDVNRVRRLPQQEVVLISTAYTGGHKPSAFSADGLFLGTLYDSVSDDDRKKPFDASRKFPSALRIYLLSEPKVRGLLWHTVKIESLIDDTGRGIQPARPFSHAIPFAHGSAMLAVDLPERPWPRKLGRMVITGKVLAAGNSETAVITDLASDNSPPVDAGGFHIETSSRNLSDGTRLITMNLTRQGNTAPAWLRPSSRIDLLEPTVFDKQGRVENTYVRDNDWFGKAFRMETVVTPPMSKQRNPNSDPGPAHKLMLELPTDVVEYDVRLEFKDVTLF